MGRNAKILPTKSLPITVTLPLYETLEEVVKSGLYGNSVPACAERLICEGLRNLKKEGTILPKKLNAT